MLTLGKNDHKTAFDRLMQMKECNDKTVLPQLPGPSCSGFQVPSNEPAGESERFLISWITCRQHFCTAILFFLVEVIFLLSGIGILGTARGPALFMIIFAIIALIVISIEWWNRWMWRETSAMQITPHVYPSRVSQVALQLNRQQALLMPPNNLKNSYIVTPAIQVVSPCPEMCQEFYPNGGGFKGRVAALRRHDQTFVCNNIILVIIYVISFLCLFGGMIWVSHELKTLSTNSAQSQNSSVTTPTIAAPTIATTTTTTRATKSASSASSAPNVSQSPTEASTQNALSSYDLDDRKSYDENESRKSKVRAIEFVLIFIVMHFIMLLIRGCTFFNQSKIYLRSLVRNECSTEKNDVPVVVPLQNYPPLPDLHSRYI